MIELSIDKVKNGYTIAVAGESCMSEDTWVASTQDEVAKVVKTIIRGAFGSSEDSQPSGHADLDFFEVEERHKEEPEEKADEEE